MTSETTITKVLELFVRYSHHSMDKKICKGCNQAHHYILCPYDVLMGLPNGEELVKKFEKMTKKLEKNNQ